MEESIFCVCELTVKLGSFKLERTNNLLISCQLQSTNCLMLWFALCLSSGITLYSFQKTDLLNPSVNNFDNLTLSSVDKVTTGTLSFASVIF